MICFDKKIIFIHIPRTAGESIKDFLKNISNDWNDDIPHLKLEEYENKYHIDLNDYFIFTCVRNPYDTLFSIFRNNKFKKNIKSLKNKNYGSWVLSLNNNKNIKEFSQSVFLLCEKDIKITVLKFEKLKKDFNRMIKKLGFDKYELKHFNKLKRTKGYLLKKELEEIIYNIYKVDFKSFKYNRNEGELLIKHDK